MEDSASANAGENAGGGEESAMEVLQAKAILGLAANRDIFHLNFMGNAI